MRGSGAYAALFHAPAIGDRAWAPRRIRLVAVAAETVAADGVVRPWAAYDTGQALAVPG